MDLKGKYINYRKRLVELHMKILNEFVSGEDYKKSAEILGIMDDNKVVLESDSERDALYDFSIYGNIRSGSNALSEYMKEYSSANKEDEELLLAMKKSDVLLYEIADHDKKDGLIMLKNPINNLENIKLIDIGMGEHLNPNIIIFTRLIHLDEFSMTSGLMFAFLINHQDYLVKRSQKMMKKIESCDDSSARFISFFMLNRSNGLPVLHEKVK